MHKKLLHAFSLLLLVLLAGCQEKVTPEERLESYITEWNEQNFQEMYTGFLTQGTKEAFSTDDFVERQEKFANDLGIKNLEVTYTEPAEGTEWNEEEPADFPIHIKMDTVAGPVEFDKTVTLLYETQEENENWFAEWDPSFIFPQLEAGDKVGITTLESSRGEIMDRNGQPIAINGSGFEIGIVPEKFTDPSKKAPLAELLGITVEHIDAQLKQSWVQPNVFVPIAVIAKAEEEVLEQVTQIPGVTNQTKPMREYPYGEALSHLSGYVGTINAEELAERQDQGYTETDLIGKRGLELILEDRLRGTDGKQIYIEKPQEGTDRIVVAETPAANGETVTLTINADLQQTIYGSMRGEAGTSAAVDPSTGETLALVSSPGFNPNLFVHGISSEQYKKLQENPLNPLLNRFSTAYAPGSTLKPVTAAIGLEAGTLDPAEGLAINGETWQKDSSWGSYEVTRVHPEAPNPIDLNKALVYSDNIYFAQQALKMGNSTFTEGLRRFGFGKEIPFTYGLNASQISNDGSIGSEGQLADTSFGQGQMLTNILHLASIYEAFLTDGVMYKPTLLLNEKDAQIWKDGLISAENAALLRTSLRNVVTGGFAQPANLPSIPLAGKTGTAELKATKEESGQQNGFFVAYNTEDPSFILAMMVESVEDNDGSVYVTELASTVFKTYYQ